MDSEKTFLEKLIGGTCKTFAVMILLSSIIGWIFGDRLRGEVIFFTDADGLSFEIILQMLVLSFVNFAISLGATKTKLYQRINVLWQLTITGLICLVATACITSVFDWVQYGTIAAWIRFGVIFIIIYVLFATIVCVKTMYDNMRYNRLLSDYREAAAFQKTEHDTL